MSGSAKRRNEDRTPRAGAMLVTERGVEDPTSAGQLGPKVDGVHRWVAAVMYALPERAVRNEMAYAEGDTSGPMSTLDHETRLSFNIGCYDCEESFPKITPDTVCPGDPSGVTHR